MQKEEVLEIFRQAGAILEGHFILTSGRHSAIYFQKAHVFMHTSLTERLCRALAQKIQHHIGETIDYIVGPAIGGLIPAYETARHLNVPILWVERNSDGCFLLKRFAIKPGAHIVILDDIVTTGLSINETIVAVEKAGGKVLAAACILDRSVGNSQIPVPLISLAEYAVTSYSSEELPPELASIPAIKPGSRRID